MINKIYIFSIALLILSTFNAFSQSQETDEIVRIKYNTGSKTSQYFLSDLQKITFSDNGIQLWATNWPTEYPYNNVQTITFGKKGNGTHTMIASLIDSNAKVNIAVNKAKTTLVIVSNAFIDGISIYNLQGYAVLKEKTKAQMFNIPIGSLPTGIYVVKMVIDGEIYVKKFVK